MAEAYTKTQRAFVEFWGEMAAEWGISRTMAQIYALLYSSVEPIDTDDIMRELNVSRGNANINLRKLLSWQLVSKIERPETRRDYFFAEKDVWKLTINVIQQRRQRELKPVADILQDLASNLVESEDETARNFREQLSEMAEFLRLFDELTFAVLPLLENKDSTALKMLIDLLKQTATQITRYNQTSTQVSPNEQNLDF